MAFVPLSKYDVFVSYAVVDNGQPLGKRYGWVTAFVDQFEVELARRLGRREYFELWVDRKRLSCNDVFSFEIEANLRQSAVMVVLYSQGYLESSWCSRERETFMQSVTDRVDPDRRLFLVEIDRVEADRRPHELKRINYLRLWEENVEGEPTRFGWPVPNPSWDSHQSFYTKVDALGRRVATQLSLNRRKFVNHLSPSAKLRLENQVAVVTGGTRGIGEGVVRRFFQEGAHVVFSGRSRERGKAIEE
jgi:hypothetical protein